MPTLKQTCLLSAAAIGGMLLLWLERFYRSGETLTLLIPQPDSPLTALSLIISGLTSPPVLIVVTLILSVTTVVIHHKKLALLFSGLLAFTGLATYWLKEFFELPRPPYAILDAISYGFPSGHAATATVALVMVVWFSYHAQPEKPHQRTVFWATFGWILICASRVLLGVHSLSDILAGVFFGVAIGSIAVWGADKLIYKHWLSLPHHE